MSKDAKVLEPNDLLSLVRLGKLQAEMALLREQAQRIDGQFRERSIKAATISKALNEKYDLDPKHDDIDDETGDLIRNVRPRPATVTTLEAVK